MRRLRSLLRCSLLVATACAAPEALPGIASEEVRSPAPVNVSQDQTAQNEPALAVNPLNPSNLIVGMNDWNRQNGPAFSTSFDGGATWTPVFPNGNLPGVTKYTNDPAVPGTGVWDAGGDPALGFGPDGTAYFACQAFTDSTPYRTAIVVSRSSDGGRTWLDGVTQPLVTVSTWQSNGLDNGANGHWPDHERMYVDQSPTSPFRGAVYLAWAQIQGSNGSNYPVQVAVSRDGARSFGPVVTVTSSATRQNEDVRVVGAPDGTVFLVWDTVSQGNKGMVLYASSSSDGGATWSAPAVVAALTQNVCTFPSYCGFNLSGTPFRSGGTYPSPAFDAARGRLVVAWPDLVNGAARIFVSSAAARDLAHWSTPVEVAPTTGGDRFQSELSVAPGGRYDVTFYDRSYSGNQLLDVTYASSRDGGASFTATRVTSAGLDPARWGVPTSTGGLSAFFGDYNSIVSLPGGAALVWTGPGPTPGSPAGSNLDIFFAWLPAK
jgi:hypothetical protein